MRIRRAARPRKVHLAVASGRDVRQRVAEDLSRRLGVSVDAGTEERR